MAEYKNYICIDGKKAELTSEQLKALGIELKKPSSFERVVNHTPNDFFSYYFIDSIGAVQDTVDHGFCNGNGTDDLRYRTANYCTDKSIMEQRALHETLSRLLWRYSMEHDGDKIDWSDDRHCSSKYYICFDNANKKWDVYYTCTYNDLATYFVDEETARAAIEEIINPFMEVHPNFKL